MFTVENPTLTFEDGKSVAEAVITYKDINLLGVTDQYVLTLGFDEAKASPTNVNSITVKAQRKLTFNSIGTGTFTSNIFGESWPQVIEKAVEADVYLSLIHISSNGLSPEAAGVAALTAMGSGAKAKMCIRDSYKGEKVTLQAYPDNVKDFYQTGMSYINNVSVAGGGEKADFRTSFSSVNQKGIIPESDYNKYSFSVNAGMDFNSKFSARVSAQYLSLIHI